MSSFRGNRGYEGRLWPADQAHEGGEGLICLRGCHSDESLLFRLATPDGLRQDLIVIADPKGR